MEFKPPFINVTYHSSEYTYKERANGFLEKVSIRKRPGTVGICASIIHRYKVDAVAHLICGGFSQNETENVPDHLRYLGIKKYFFSGATHQRTKGISSLKLMGILML